MPKIFSGLKWRLSHGIYIQYLLLTLKFIEKNLHYKLQPYLEYLILKVAFMEIKFLFSKQNTVSEFQFLDNSNAPLHYSFKHLIESIQYFNLLADKKTVIPAVL